LEIKSWEEEAELEYVCFLSESSYLFSWFAILLKLS
jgi:hypothetical protein